MRDDDLLTPGERPTVGIPSRRRELLSPLHLESPRNYGASAGGGVATRWSDGLFAADKSGHQSAARASSWTAAGAAFLVPLKTPQDELLQEKAAPEAFRRPQSKPNVGGAGGLRLGPIKLALGRLPTSLTVVAMAGVGAHRLLSSRTSQALDDELDAECKALSDLTLTKRVEPPAGCSKRQALEELRARKQLLTEHVVPMLKTLEQLLDGRSWALVGGAGD